MPTYIEKKVVDFNNEWNLKNTTKNCKIMDIGLALLYTITLNILRRIF